MTERIPERRAGDLRLKRLVILVAVIGGILLLAAATSSTIAIVGAVNAQNAADSAQRAADAAAVAIHRTERNAATLVDLCQVARRQRKTLKLSLANSEQYLASPAGGERTALNDFVRAISLPQLRARIKTETVPPSCRHRRRGAVGPGP